MDQSVSRSRNGSKRSHRSSLTVDIPHAPSSGVPLSQQGAQSSAQSPAVVVNVVQPGATFVHSPAHPSWHPSGTAGDIQPPNTTALSPPVEKRSSKGSHSSVSKHSGSESSSSNNNSVANNDNANDNWQNTTSGAQDWATNTQGMPKIPGAWRVQDNLPRGPSQWNENENNHNSWAVPNNPQQANQTANDQTQWDNSNNNNNNSGTDHTFQKNNWDEGAKDGNGGWNESWANNNGPTQHIAGGMLPQQSNWENVNDAGNANGNGATQSSQNQPDQGQNWGPASNNNGNPVTQSWNNFGNIQPASVKPYNSGPSMAPGFVPSATADTAAFHQYLANGHPPVMPMPLQPKAYWSKWKAGPELEPEPEPEVEVVEGPIHQVPRDVAQRHWMSHQVLLGKPAAYMHKTSKPKYIDSHENPYAVFVFHYRSKGTCNNLCADGYVQTNSITRGS